MAGRPPTPTPVLKAKGTFRKDRHAGRADTKVDHGPMGPPPRGLCTTARAEWRRVVAQMKITGVGSKVDAATLAAYCRTWAEWRRLTKIVNSRKFNYFDENSRKISRLLGQTEDRLCKLAQQYGFTPSSRTKVIVDENAAGEGPKKDVESKFFKGPKLHAG